MKINKFISIKIDEIFGADLRSLALLRMGLAIVVILDIIFRLPDLRAFYSDEGIMPRNLHIELYGSSYISAYLLNGLSAVVGMLFITTVFFAILFFFGFHTKIANIVLWFLMTSLHGRNPLVLTGGDTLLHLILFWCMFLPLNACFSLDSFLSPKTSSKKEINHTIFSIPVIALFTQIAFVYSFTAACKIGPEWMKDGTAIYYALNIDQYVTPFGHSLLHFPKLLQFMTPCVFWLEAIGSLFMFSPVFNPQIRLITIFAFICLQLGFGYCLTVGIFPYITTVAILAFLPGLFWDKILPVVFKIKLLNSFMNYFVRKFSDIAVFLSKSGLAGSSQNNKLNLSTFVNIIVAFFLTTILLWNVQSVEVLKFKMPTWLSTYSYFFGLEQSWIMFGPKFLREDFWYVYPGILKNGKRVDVFNKGSEITWDRPSNLANFYSNHRWKTYIRNLWVSDKRLQPYYAQYLCGEWNKNHTSENQLSDIYFYYAREITLPNNKVDKPIYGLMYSHKCY